MEYYSAIKNNDNMKFLSKLMEVEEIIPKAGKEPDVLQQTMDTENVVYLHNGLLLSYQKNDFMKFIGKWMELEYIILSEFCEERASYTKLKRVVWKRSAPEDFLDKRPNKKILIGNEELTRLWNLCPDNMEACKLETREYMPILEEFFEEAIEQADAENMVESEYKAINNSNYGWSTLRLLAWRSPHFFQPTNQQFKNLTGYLENMVIKLAKELPPHSEEIKTGEDEDEEDNDTLLKENESPNVRQDKPITGEQTESFTNKLGEQWKILAPYLEIKDSDIRQIECDSEDMKKRAKQLLVAWKDQERVHETTDNLIGALNKSGLSDLAESLTNDTETNSYFLSLLFY
ncbi:LOW QUALITY PROTEIN: THO complex subunit 1-like [Rattus rattus]|uniref:LOW QUALITY PROTEIN: THO complex subunit 1-like n=1 Tax=Rattus rattus TaxID=10117 RepID=UPI0013F34715|nr:LOW QUALITY PROTEIN: THO complex subunit 1-like [Rattus rattus]